MIAPFARSTQAPVAVQSSEPVSISIITSKTKCSSSPAKPPPV